MKSVRPPRPDSEHYPFYRHILDGGRVWRDDPLNGVKEWIDLARLGGDAAAIGHFGFMDLSIPDQEVAMNAQGVVMTEVARAIEKYPTWPTDPLHALAVLGEEFGELTKAVLQLTYEPHKTSLDEVRSEAIQTAAMALRFVASLDRYEYRPGEQHKHPPLAEKSR